MALIILWESSLGILSSFAQDNNLQFQLGDQISIYAEKAYRKNQGAFFEAVGSVVIKSVDDTLYGERASFDLKTGEVKVEGNVRFISKDITIYGSKLDFNRKTNKLEVLNGRIITSDFSIVAKRLVKKSDSLYDAFEAEFTTCKDCVESWSVYGEYVEVELNQYIKARHALTKIKGISILYIPYIVLPIKNKRESGLLVPSLSSRLDEGVAYEQPIFWAINKSKDMTFTPSFWGRRGYGTDLEYRQEFAEKMWLNYNHRFVQDSIYLPEKIDNELSNKKYFRHFYSLESHLQWSNSLTQHFSAQGTKDLDFSRDFSNYSDGKINESDLGYTTFLEKRLSWINFGIEGAYRRNLLVKDAESFDKNYIQILPSLYLNTTPYTFLQSDTFLFQNMTFGIESEYTIFKQVEENESSYLRNARRVDLRPYLNWQLFTYGPLEMKSKLTMNFQEYAFKDRNQKNFLKMSEYLLTEISFSMDKVFGLSYSESIDTRKLSDEVTKNISLKSKENKVFTNSNTIGKLPSFESSLTSDYLKVVRNSYRHSQQFRFLHHFTTNSKKSGNSFFENQIKFTEGWFDYRDAIQEDLSSIGSNNTRTTIPTKNTIELQWNNSLIRKTPKNVNYFADKRYLRDNFTYSKIGHFNISQGFILEKSQKELEENNLTRLFIDTGYVGKDWTVSVKEYYFHSSSNHIFNFDATKRIDKFNFLVSYNYNGLTGSNLKNIRVGMQIRPTDAFGFSFVKEQDLFADQNLKTVYQLDYMPDNHCWLLNMNFKDSIIDKRFALNFVFNFGNEEYSQYRNNFFDFSRLE